MAGRYRALLIGNSSFPADAHNLQALVGPVNDVATVRAALCHEEVGIFDAGDVRLVAERTVHEVRMELDRFFSTAHRDDTLLLYYSGHGVLDQRNQLFLCARDTRTDLLKATGVGAADIGSMFEESAAAATVIVLDCCHSGAFKSGQLADSLQGKGRYLLTSARSRELAADATTENGTSLFTHHLVEGILRGAADVDGDGFADLDDLYEYVYDRLGAEARQIPQRSFAGDGTVAIARRSADRSVPVPPVVAVDRAGQPVLKLSTLAVDLGVVAPGSVPAPVEVFVVNEGGGSLDWVATTADDWIDIEPHTNFFRMAFHPTGGTQSGRVEVRARSTGAASSVAVTARMAEKPEPARQEPSGGRRRNGEASVRPRWLVGALVAAAAAVVVLVVSLVAMSLGGDDPSPGQADGADQVTVLVPGDEPWVATGIMVSPGDRVRVQASGTIIHDVGLDRSSGPDGDPNPDVQQFNVSDALPHGGLLGRIAEGGEPFAVGAKWDFTGPLSGQLYLQVNDVGLGNNAGQFSATVTLTPA